MLKAVGQSQGLLGTNVQWDDVERIAQQQSGSKNLKIGLNRSIRPLAEGVGLQSLLGIAEIEWIVQGGGGAPYPKKFALKIGSPVALLQALKAQAAKLPPNVASNISEEFIKFLPPCHNSEIYFYEYFRNSRTLPKLSILPDYYFGNTIALQTDGSYTKGCIGIELVEDCNTKSPLENFSDAQMLQVLDSLSRLQVQFIDMPEEKRRSAPHQGLAGLYQTVKDWFLQLNNGLMAQFPDPEMQELTAKFAASLPDIISADDLDLVPVQWGMKKVLVHGDLWSANILWDLEGNLKKLIDFQMIHFGLAGTDLARLMNTCLTPEDRHANKDRYLRHYFECLEKRCREIDRPLPFSYEQLTLSYDLVYPRVSAYLLPALTAILEKAVTMPDIPAKPIIVGSFISKVKGIYSDIIATHASRPTSWRSTVK